MTAPQLLEYQRNATQAARASPGIRHIFNDETGLGKTAEAISVLRGLESGPARGANRGTTAGGTTANVSHRTLVIAPAMVRNAWVGQFKLWWPELWAANTDGGAATTTDPARSPVGVLWAGARKQLSKRKRAELEAAGAAPIVITSPGLLVRLLSQLVTQRWEHILIDECHLYQDPGSQWSKALRRVVRANPAAAVLGLSATILPDRPLDFWNIGDILCPGRFGQPTASGRHSFKFCQRYTNASHNGYGWAYRGVALDTADELRARIAAISSRATKAEWGHLLPPFTVRRVDAEPGTSPIDFAVEWATQALTEATHVAVLTHLRESARAITQVLSGGPFTNVPTICITGDESVTERQQKLADLRGQPQGILVATMHSVGIGIDLTWCTRALAAELYWRPETIIQMLGRFSRLSGTAPSLVDLLVVPGTVSERICVALLEKLMSITAVTAASSSETKLIDALGGGLDEIKLAQELRDAVALSGPLDDNFDPGDEDE